MLDRVRAVITLISANALDMDTDSQVWQGEKKRGDGGGVGHNIGAHPFLV